MHKIEKNQKKRGRFFWSALLLTLFCILKVMRGADTNSVQQGGIWNYISLLYYPFFILYLIKISSFRVKLVFVAPLIYSIWSMLVSFRFSTSISVIYAYLMIPYFFLVFSVFYFSAENSIHGEKLIVATYIICLAINIWTIIIYLFFEANRAVASDIYYSLCMLPFVLVILKNSKIKNLLLILQFITVFLANKRTGLIGFIFGYIVYYLLMQNSKKSRVVAFRNILILAVVGILFYNISYYFDQKLGLNIYYRLMRLSEDGGSGRETIYNLVWENYKNSSLFAKLFGHGLNTAGSVGGAGHAHNDFLEVLYNFGITACICLILFYIALFGEASKMAKCRSPYAPAFTMSLVIGFLLSMFSYFLIYYTYVTCSMAFWGYILAMERRRLLHTVTTE